MRIAAVVAILAGLSQPARAELGKDQVRKAIKAHMREVIACYERAPDAIDHRAVVTFTIAASGKVTKAVGSGNPAVHDCLAGVIRAIAFPASSSSTEVSYPFWFDAAGS
jgi:hypothetical protein